MQINNKRMYEKNSIEQETWFLQTLLFFSVAEFWGILVMGSLGLGLPLFGESHVPENK